MLQIDESGTRRARSRGRKKKTPEVTAKGGPSPHDTSKIARTYPSSAAAAALSAMSRFSVKAPPIVTNNNNVGPSGLVFAVKSRPVPLPMSSPELPAPPRPAPVTATVTSSSMAKSGKLTAAERAAVAAKRTIQCLIGDEVLKFSLGEGQLGVASGGTHKTTEKGMPHLSQTLDVPIGSNFLPMPELTAVDHEIRTVPKVKVVSGGPLRPKPRFYFNRDDLENNTTTTTIKVTAAMLNNSIKAKTTKTTKVPVAVTAPAPTPPVVIPTETVTVTGGRSVRNKRKKEVFDPSDLFTPRKKVAVSMSQWSMAGVVVKQEKLDEPDEGHVGGLNHNNVSSDTGSTLDNSQPRKRGRPRLPGGPRPRVRVRKEKVPKAVVVKKSTSTQIALCASCKRYRNIKGHCEKFLICSTCSGSYHPSCANISRELAVQVRSSGKWQCVNCQTCSLCSDPLNVKDSQGILSTICSRCADGFHLKCVKLEVRPISWDCDSCQSTDGSGNLDLEDGNEGMDVEEEGEVEEVKSSTPRPVKLKRGPKPKRRYIKKGKKDDGRRAQSARVNKERSPEKLEPSSTEKLSESVKISTGSFATEQNLNLDTTPTEHISYTKDEVEPISTKRDPIPTKHEPIQTKLEPIPTKHEPIPTKHEPIPTKHEQIPSKHEPIPTKHEQIPSKHELIPTKHEPIPTKHEPIPTKHEPIPTKHEPIPTKHEPIQSKRETVPKKREHELISSSSNPELILEKLEEPLLPKPKGMPNLEKMEPARNSEPIITRRSPKSYNTIKTAYKTGFRAKAMAVESDHFHKIISRGYSKVDKVIPPVIAYKSATEPEALSRALRHSRHVRLPEPEIHEKIIEKEPSPVFKKIETEIVKSESKSPAVVPILEVEVSSVLTQPSVSISIPPAVPVSITAQAPVPIPTPSPVTASASIPDSVPVPTAVPIPTSVPIPASVSIPASDPVLPSVPALSLVPISAPASVPVRPSVQIPASAPAPTAVSNPALVPIPSSVPIPDPVQAPIQVPISVPVSTPVQQPIQIDVQAPMSIPASLPISAPVQPVFGHNAPHQSFYASASGNASFYQKPKIPAIMPLPPPAYTPTPFSNIPTNSPYMTIVMPQPPVFTTPPPAPLTVAIPGPPYEFPSNPSSWTSQQVELYLREHGLRDEGAVFREQEIDGISLMLMRRADIVQGMRLKLGPALKVHRLVAELQSRGHGDSTD